MWKTQIFLYYYCDLKHNNLDDRPYILPWPCELESTLYLVLKQFRLIDIAANMYKLGYIWGDICNRVDTNLSSKPWFYNHNNFAVYHLIPSIISIQYSHHFTCFTPPTWWYSSVPSIHLSPFNQTPFHDGSKDSFTHWLVHSTMSHLYPIIYNPINSNLTSYLSLQMTLLARVFTCAIPGHPCILCYCNQEGMFI